MAEMDWTRRSWSKGGGAPGPDPLFPPPASPPSRNFVRECRTMGAKGTVSKICLIRQRVTTWGFTPCVYTQNTHIFEETSILEEHHVS